MTDNRQIIFNKKNYRSALFPHTARLGCDLFFIFGMVIINGLHRKIVAKYCHSQIKILSLSLI